MLLKLKSPKPLIKANPTFLKKPSHNLKHHPPYLTTGTPPTQHQGGGGDFGTLVYFDLTLSMISSGVGTLDSVLRPIPF